MLEERPTDAGKASDGRSKNPYKSFTILRLLKESDAKWKLEITKRKFENINQKCVLFTHGGSPKVALEAFVDQHIDLIEPRNHAPISGNNAIPKTCQRIDAFVSQTSLFENVNISVGGSAVSAKRSARSSQYGAALDSGNCALTSRNYKAFEL